MQDYNYNLMHSDTIKTKRGLDSCLQKLTQGHNTSILCGYEVQMQAAESNSISKLRCYW